MSWAFAGLKPDGKNYFLDISAFGSQAEIIARCKEGDMVEIRGHLERSKSRKTDQWETRVVADRVLVGGEKTSEDAF